MKQISLLCICILLLYPAFGQKTNKSPIAAANTCKQNWQYFSLQNIIKGEVLFHTKAIALCGVLATASLTVVKTTAGDTIRVLEMCNATRTFAKSTMVTITPDKQPEFSVSLPQDDLYGCTIKKTCYGTVR